MIELPVLITTSSVPADYTPPDDMQGLLEALPQFTTYELDDTGANVSINSTGGADLNGLWIWMLNAIKQPPRVMTGYQNGWWPVYSGKPGEVRMTFAPPAGYFDGSGRGLEYSGWEGWCFCNGQNGTTFLENAFIVPGYRWDGGGWVTKIEGHDTYQDRALNYFQIYTWNLSGFPYPGALDHGEFQLALQATNFFKMNKHQSGEYATICDPGPQSGAFNVYWWTYPEDHAGEMWQWPISNIPPYIAVGFVQFMGYL